uniref:Ig-like domain-containing protein n=1 Tax=Echeneis naucrates TaxID=173247 RepID=A0A665T7S4_ECHNA
YIKNVQFKVTYFLGASDKECLDRNNKKLPNKTLVCVASDFYPDHVNVFWQVDGEVVNNGVTTDRAARRTGGTYHITSRLRVPFKLWYSPHRNFTCTVSFFDGNNTVYRSSWITQTVSTRYLRISCNAKLSYTVLIAKSCIYGVFVILLVWKFQVSQLRHYSFPQ